MTKWMNVGKASVPAAVLAMGLTSGALAAEGDVDVQAELKALRAKIAQLEAKGDESFLNERRTEEVKTLVREVLADADTRASLAEGGATAGYKKNFFITSEDGNFLLNVAGRLQFRYSTAIADKSTSLDEVDGGFTMRRTKLEFFGHMFDPSTTYKIVGAFDRGSGNFQLEESWIKQAFADSHYVQVGQFKLPFLREENVSSSRQLAAERTGVNEFFTLDYSQAVAVGGNYDQFRWSAGIHDGREGDNIEFNADTTDIAIAGRGEILITGDWKQFDDFVTWSGVPLGIMVGAGIDYELGEGNADGDADWTYMLQYTADVSVEFYPFSGYFAFAGRHIEFDAGQGAPLAAAATKADQWGLVAQASVFIIPDKMDIFARYEYLNYNNVTELAGNGSVSPLVTTGTAAGKDWQEIWTLGTNYYFQKHAFKLTFDVQWAPHGVRAGESGAGTVTQNSSDADQFFGRAQLQFLF